MQAVLLAAGRGTRMGALTQATPKPLLPVAGRPIIEHIILGFRAAEVRDFIIVTGYLGNQIEAALGDGERLGVRIAYRDQSPAEGTARALLLAADVLGREPFALSWGDILVQPTFYRAITTCFRQRPADAWLGLNEVEDPCQGAAVYIEPDGDNAAGGRVTRIIEKPPRGSSTTRWNNAGVFVFAPVVLDYAARLQPSARGEYELPQAIAAMVADRRSVCGLPIRGYWSDVGTAADLELANIQFPHFLRADDGSTDRVTAAPDASA